MASPGDPSSKKRQDRSPEPEGRSKKIRFPMDSASIFDLPVCLIVGKEKKMMHVHESKLTMSSDFFKNTLKGEWQETVTRMVELPGCGPDSFIIYAEWLYTGRMCTVVDGKREQNDKVVKELRELIRCYRLGSFLQDSDFRDTIIDALVDMMVCRNIICTATAKVVYNISSSKSPHRKLAVDVAVHCWSTDKFQSIADWGFSAELLTDLVVATGGKLREAVRVQGISEFFANANMCKYHEHAVNNTPCYRTRFAA
ncbi:hypothetical protein N0V86_006846 [Didymella sp. IMI 355093]|nr:hypothetical protein N0V86_006846 [Didymella sp. IMI 355093]